MLTTLCEGDRQCCCCSTKWAVENFLIRHSLIDKNERVCVCVFGFGGIALRIVHTELDFEFVKLNFKYTAHLIQRIRFGGVHACNYLRRVYIICDVCMRFICMFSIFWLTLLSQYRSIVLEFQFSFTFFVSSDYEQSWMAWTISCHHNAKVSNCRSMLLFTHIEMRDKANAL